MQNALEILRTALEHERRAAAVYTEAAEESGVAAYRALLTHFAGIEARHEESVRRVYDAFFAAGEWTDDPDAPSPVSAADDQQLAAMAEETRAALGDPDVNILRICQAALAAEKAAHDFYVAKAKEVAGPLHAYLMVLANAEQLHVAVIKRLMAPRDRR
jgi:rubrerythrin